MIEVHQVLEVASGASATSPDFTPWVLLDRMSTPFSVGFAVHTSGAGTVTYKVEHTLQKPTSALDNSVVSFTHIDVSAEVDDADGNYAYPVWGIRANAVSSSGVSTIDFFVLQAGP